MNDDEKKTLALAARAAGIELFCWDEARQAFRLKGDRGENGSRWNPLTDDGDALRLALALNFNITSTLNRHLGQWLVSSGCFSEHSENVRPGDSKAAVIRRVIVRAAASLGGAMP